MQKVEGKLIYASEPHFFEIYTFSYIVRIEFALFLYICDRLVQMVNCLQKQVSYLEQCSRFLILLRVRMQNTV